MSRWFCGFIFQLLLGYVLSQTITTPPGDITMETGGTAIFKYVTDLQNKDFTFSRTDPPLAIYTYSSGLNPNLEAGKYDVVANGETFEIKINNVAWSDGAKYQGTVQWDSADVDLVVLEQPEVRQDPEVIVEGQDAKFICEGRFGAPVKTDLNADHFPKLASFLNKEPVSGTVTEDDGSPGETGQIWVIKETMNRSLDSSYDKTEYVCELSTIDPEFKLTAVHKINVEYSVRDIMLTPYNDLYSIGQHINCSANGNTAPTFKWTAIQSAGSRPVSGASLSIEENMLGDNEWMCEATNTVAGQPSVIATTIQFTVVQASPTDSTTDDEDGGGTESWVIAVGVAVPILILLIGGVVGLILYTKKKKVPTATLR